ncbi:MAG TPA: hypothetical protein VKA40_03695 [Nitrososphaera sp.]|nr:hypothetical protein [Nitrososphaera sp.]
MQKEKEWSGWDLNSTVHLLSLPFIQEVELPKKASIAAVVGSTPTRSISYYE